MTPTKIKIKRIDGSDGSKACTIKRKVKIQAKVSEVKDDGIIYKPFIDLSSGNQKLEVYLPMWASQTIINLRIHSGIPTGIELLPIFMYEVGG